MQRGNLVAVSRSGELAVIDTNGRERERYKVPYGANILIDNESKVSSGKVVAQWDPHTHPIITEVEGRVRFIDFVDGVTMNRQTDEVTGLTSIVVMSSQQRSSAGKELRPMVKLVDAKGNDLVIPGSNLASALFLT